MKRENGTFVMPERERLEVYLSEGGEICIAQNYHLSDEPYIIGLAPDQVQEVVDAMLALLAEVKAQ